MGQNNKSNKDKSKDSQKENNKNNDKYIQLKNWPQDLLKIGVDLDAEARSKSSKLESPKDTLVTKLAEELNKKRVSILEKAFEEADKLVEEIQQLKPDVEAEFDSTGASLGARYKKSTYDNKVKKIDRYNSIKSAILKAWNSNDWEDLEKIYNKKDKKK